MVLGLGSSLGPTQGVDEDRQTTLERFHAFWTAAARDIDSNARRLVEQRFRRISAITRRARVYV